MNFYNFLVQKTFGHKRLLCDEDYSLFKTDKKKFFVTSVHHVLKAIQKSVVKFNSPFVSEIFEFLYISLSTFCLK